ncbi:helix-turn-helix domain-containing protein [Alicyclobacillus hesperidum]|nr:helix-turn-helix transcriptional regulator [Alicyclobacillus hesperidum]
MRLSHGLRQEEVAKKSIIKRPYYCQIEMGVRTPSIDVAKRIADQLQFDWTRFFEEPDSEDESYDAAKGE